MRDASTIRGETSRVPGAAGLGCRVEVLDWSLPAAAAFNFRRLPMRGRALAAAIWASAHAGGRSFRKPRADGLSWQNLPEPTSMSLSAQKLGISVRFIRHCAMHKKSGGRAIRTGRVDWRRTKGLAPVAGCRTMAKRVERGLRAAFLTMLRRIAACRI